MPGRRKRNRKSLFGRLRKPFSLGRLGRKEAVATTAIQSPTSVAEWQDPQFHQKATAAGDVQRFTEDILDEIIEVKEKTDDHDIIEKDDSRVVVRQVPQRSCHEVSDNENSTTPNRLLRDFSYPDASLQDDMNFRPVSPMSLGSDDDGDDEEQKDDNHNSGQAQSISPLSSQAGSAFFSCNTMENDLGSPKSIKSATSAARQEYDEQSVAASQKQTMGSQESEDANLQDKKGGKTMNEDTDNQTSKGRGGKNSQDSKHKENNTGGASTFHDEASSQDTLNPEELFNKGEPVIVDIVKGAYKKHKQGRIVAIKTKVKVCIQENSSSEKETWLARTSLSYMGESFPIYHEANSQGKGGNANQSKKKDDRTIPTRGSQQPDNHTFAKGDLVAIVGGTYKHNRGRVVQVKTRVKVAIDAPKKDVWLAKKSLQKLDNSSTASLTASQGSRSGFFSCDETDDSKQKVPAYKSRSSNMNGTPSEYLVCGDNWRLTDSGKGGSRLGLRKLIKSRYQIATEEDHLLAYWLQSRMRIVEVPINNAELKEPIPKIFEESDGSKFELAISKIQSDGDKAAPAGVPSKKCVHLYYCQISGPGLQTILLQEEFERIADFASLGPKVGARLELFLSPAYKLKSQTSKKTHAIHMVNEKAFCEIAETGNEGCGFISKELLVELLGGGKAAERAYAIQVRGSTAFGMFKGVLVKKMIKHGDPPIQIPSSMVVVGPSRAGDRRENGFLVINRNGVHPNSTNAMVDRLLRGVETSRTFRNELQRKKLSDMIVRLWIGLGVPKSICDQYLKDCQKEKNLQHAFVVGLADPTSQLPSGFICIPGLDHSGEIFVTRSPCLEAADARKIPVVTTKPAGMSRENWDFLQGLSFGSIIFANPKQGEIAMPVMIADGDLDGDLYFICWREQILEHVRVLPLNPTASQQESKGTFSYHENWFTEAQDRMIDVRSSQLLGQIIGKLWSKAKSIAEETNDFTRNDDYKAFAAAYKDALKIGKHGGKVYLPGRLHSCLPEKFHYVLTDVKT